MSDLHHWRHVQFHNRIEWAHPESHEKSVQAFDDSPMWERVHVLSDAELAAHDAQVRAEAGCTLPSEGAEALRHECDAADADMRKWVRVPVKYIRAILASAPTVEQVRQEERERIAAAIRGSGLSATESFIASDGHRSVGVLTGEEIRDRAARIAEQGGA